MRCVFLRSPKRLCGQNRITQSLKYIFHDSKSANACTRSRLPTPSSPGWSHLWGFVFGQNGEKATRQDQETGRMEILLGTTFSHSHTFWRCFFLWLCCERLRYALARTVVVVVSFCMRWCNKRYVLQQIKSSGAPMKQDHLSFLTTAVCATSTAEQTTSRTRTNEPFLGVDVIMMMSI